ncbi:hypothetical protein [Heyndrickxia camelliae]|uniref:hypothetical protein n=1 Tax=Heyndrickxia camelliae TaxID=1707093 RepID=UPI0013FD9FED|nr:hypothetical protein [Heyndrickxia camelliae]
MEHKEEHSLVKVAINGENTMLCYTTLTRGKQNWRPSPLLKSNRIGRKSIF